ncbi:DUF1080 domain-containing protein [Ramlibacter sp.]|uniref:3-keto-disaccharide hydrolase n=1 Tax=Ramlibacter sp. TaxID=1917967 RepID=UPI00262182F5|nr:DUF1080 domain-containing protein [Ramlibacter sp.]MDB5957927.1 putative exported protein of unknown function [Ramlibacter sp.]
MKRSTFLAAALCAATLAGCAGMGMSGNAGWETLIDGEQGLANFDRIGEANWRAEQGAIVADRGAGGYLVSRKPYRDFQLRAEFWADATTNSGVFLRATEPAKIAAATAYEVNIFDQRPDPSYGTGAIVNVAKVVPMPKAGGQWNVYEITARGSHLTVVLNGVRTVDVEDSKFAQGPIALQYGLGANDRPGGPIKFRKVLIRSL